MEGQEQKSWLKKLWELLFPPNEPPQPEQSRPNQHKESPEQQRYQVQDTAGRTVGQSDSLANAHRQWQNVTGQEGTIIDTLTGEDVTPPPDNNGRYVVMDASGEQLESFSDKEAALESWRETTNEKGQVIDTKTGEDITARLKGFLTKQQLKEVTKLVQGGGFGRGPREQRLLGLDPDLIKAMMEQLNSFPVPAFNVMNLAGKARNAPTKMVEIKRRKVIIETVKKMVEIEAPGPPSPSGRKEVPYPTDEQDTRRIRHMSDLTRVPPSRLAMPRQLLNDRLARRQLVQPMYEQEVPGKPTVKKRKVWRDFEEPKVQEWTEQVEVTDETRAQLLEIVVDISGSMAGSNINLAIALAALLVGKHLDDESRYFYRQFADYTSKIHEALTPNAKRKFIRFLIDQEDDDVGGGTDIMTAIRTAASDVREAASNKDRPEVVLITDGNDLNVTADSVYGALGQDVTLHAVVVGGFDNPQLKEHSTTYYHLYWDGTNVNNSSLGSSPWSHQ